MFMTSIETTLSRRSLGMLRKRLALLTLTGVFVLLFSFFFIQKTLYDSAVDHARSQVEATVYRLGLVQNQHSAHNTILNRLFSLLRGGIGFFDTELATKQGLVVMTNAIKVATRLLALENEPTLLMTGGTWDPHSESFQGQVAENVLCSYDFDQLFIGADGIDVARGTTTFNELVGLSQVMAKAAREVIVLVESEKIGRKIPNLELPWQTVTTLITDSGLASDKRAAIEACGVKLICAEIME